MIDSRDTDEDQERLNAAVWSQRDLLLDYASTRLRGAEQAILAAHPEHFAGAVLELGCGAGRLTGHLCRRARSVHAVDISPAMVSYTARAHPQAIVGEGDLRDLSRFEAQSFDVVFAPYNVLDVVGEQERLRVLQEIHRVLVGGGLFVLSSHNRSFASPIPVWLRVLIGSPRRPLASLKALPQRARNRRRMRALEREELGYALRNDEAHDFSLLHYNATRDAQAAQLASAGFELLECLDLDGRDVAPGEDAPHSSELHYVCRAPAG